MKKLFVPSSGVASWRALLADPGLHWKRGASAMELAASWERAVDSDRGLPPEVERALDQHPATRGGRLLFGSPEHKVDLPGGDRPSQTDLWAVLGVGGDWASVAVEGKATESFGPTVNDWLSTPSDGKRARLSSLCDTLGVPRIDGSPLRYQLFHRTASAVIEAKRIGARTAVLLVQNFHKESQSWADFQRFVEQFGVTACRDGICEARCPGVDRLLFAWVDSEPMSDEEFERFPGAAAEATNTAYRETSFIAETPGGEIVIRVGARHAALDTLLAQEGATEWAFITASNPHPQNLRAEENQARNRALREGLRVAGLKFFPGTGVGADGAWSEESVLVIGVDRETALAVGRRYAQAAIVVGTAGKAAKLLYCQ